MQTVIIVIHLMVIIALVAVILMQRSEGGALGIGGGGGSFLSTRSQGNVLTRSTAILAAVFFLTSIGLTILGRYQDRPGDILDTVPTAAAPAAPVDTSPTPVRPTTPSDATAAPGQGILDQLNQMSQQPDAPHDQWRCDHAGRASPGDAGAAAGSHVAITVGFDSPSAFMRPPSLPSSAPVRGRIRERSP